ncbi:MAG: hypothetical protein JWN12_660 [Candidatus Saccharibacteria bacterium]|nr:hypothetical protein [Candidatus Saccharibacteria bacterium]
MTGMEDLSVSTSTVSTITIPIQISEAITQVAVEDIPSEELKFVSENLSVKDIKKVIRHDLNCRIRVYYSRTRARFLVIVRMPYGLLRVADVIKMFAAATPEAVISPVGELLSKEEAEGTPVECELFKALTTQDVEREIGKFAYLMERELRPAS